MKPSPGSMKSATPRNPLSQSLVQRTPRSDRGPRRDRFPVWRAQRSSRNLQRHHRQHRPGDWTTHRKTGKTWELENTSSFTPPTTAATDRNAMENCALKKDLNSKAGTASPASLLEGRNPWRTCRGRARRCHRPSSSLCGLIGIKKPAKIHLDGSDLTPILTGSEVQAASAALLDGWREHGPSNG